MKTTTNNLFRSFISTLPFGGVIGWGLLLASCLSEDPRGALTEDQAYKDATMLELSTVAPIYNNIGGNADSEGLQGTYRGVYDLNTFSTDEAMLPTRGGDWYDGGLWQSLYLHRWTASDKPLSDTWNYLYKVVMLCNRSIETLTEHRSLLTEAQYQADIAELRALRAMFYFYIMDLWGSVPVVTSSSTSDAVTQQPRSEVFRFIVSELQEAAPLLPAERSNSQGSWYGRMTQPVAHFLLAKLMLNAEVYADDDVTDGSRPDGSSLSFTVDSQTMNAWQACAYYCDLLTAFGYTLEDSYSTNFAVHNDVSKENIFTIPMDKYLYANQYKYLFRSRHYSHGSALGFDAENGTVATLSTCSTFGYAAVTDGSPVSTPTQPDPRWSLNFYYDNVIVDGSQVLLPDGTPLVYQPLEVRLDLTGSPYEKTAGARMAKYEIDRKAYADGNLQDNDIVLFRYADVLLMLAEAKMRMGQGGLDELNKVRARVGLSPLTAIDDDTILSERLKELMWEGWRRNDLIRFARFHRAYDQRPQLDSEASAYTTLFPIPGGVIDLNPSIRQNPGY